MLLFAEAAATAETVSSNTNTALQVGVLILSLITLFTLLEKGLSIYRMTRPQPPVQELIRQCATKEDFAGLQLRISEIKSENGASIKNTNASIEKLERRLDEEMHSVRSYNAKNTREIYDALGKMQAIIQSDISVVRASMNEEFKDLNKAIGRLEGSTKNTSA